jgi:hypothetical protein
VRPCGSAEDRHPHPEQAQEQAMQQHRQVPGEAPASDRQAEDGDASIG